MRGLDLTKQFSAAGRAWVELDDDGNVVERGKVSELASKPRKPTSAKRKPPAPRAGRRAQG